MSNRIIFTVVTGPHRNKQFVFEDKISCLAGRGEDCFVRLFGEFRDQQISRRHCELEIEPPNIWVRDLGSRNGTFVNGVPVKPCTSCTHKDPTSPHCVRASLKHGDVLTIGGSSLYVTIPGQEES